MAKSFSRTVWTIVFAVLLIFSGLALFKILVQSISYIKLFMFFGIGIGLYTILLFVLRRKTIEGLDSFIHELTHAIVATLLFRKVQSFWATAKEGGQISYTGKPSFVITLAPYCFPFITLFFILIKQYIVSDRIWIFDVMIGLTFAFHYHAYLTQTKTYQTDLKKYGYMFSYIYIIAVNFLFIGIIFLSFRMSLLQSIKYWFSLIYENIYSLVKYLELI